MSTLREAAEPDWLDEEPFYNAMQRYRCAPREDQREIVACFEAVKRLVRAELAKPDARPAPAEPQSCSLGCTTECKAKMHGCASECPALPWQPPAPAEPQPAAQQELKPQAATMCSCIECIGDQPEPTPEDLVQAAQQERKPLTDEWINRHSTVAIGCPLGSKVILVSSLRRLLGITATKGDRHD